MNTARNSLAAALCAALVALLAGACATPPQTPATGQPALAAVVQPYADDLRRAGIHSVQAFGNGARVRLSTHFGDIYLGYPAGLAATAFVIYVDPATVEVDSDTFTPAASPQYEAAIKAILPPGIKLTNENNARVREQRLLYNN